jgi:hypothetical protein
MPTLKLVPTRHISTPIIELLFFGERHKFIVDTGASNSVISYALFNKFPLTELHYNNIETGKLYGTAGHRKTMLVPFTIRILGKLTDCVSVGYFLDEWHKETGLTFSGLLGQDIMTQFKRVYIDYEVGTISFS